MRVSSESKTCGCDDVDVPLLQNVAQGFDAMGFLPLTKMGQIQWLPGYERTDPVVLSTASATDSSVSARTLVSPTTRDSTMTTSSSNTSSSTSTIATPTTANAAATDGSTDSNDSSSPLTTGEKAAIGIGAILGSALIMSMLIVGFRNRQEAKQEKKEYVNDDRTQDQEKNVITPASEPAMLDAEAIQRDSTWSGQKSELPGSPPGPSHIRTASPISEAPTRNDEHVIVYQPFRYRNAEMGGGIELSQEERSIWPGVDYAAYRAQQARNENYGQAGHSGRDGRGGTGDAHELPG